LKTDSRQVFGDILCNIVGFINCQSKGGYYFLCCTIFLNVLKNKDQLLSPDDNSRFAILCKRTTVEQKVSRASESDFGVPSVSSEQDEDVAESDAEACSGRTDQRHIEHSRRRIDLSMMRRIRVMKTPRSLIRTT